MVTRKAISKTARFEVFKRDKFTCQYCGAKAPDVVLQIDHIRPVAQEGTNEIVNLVTSCNACNSGKGARQLDDNSIVEKQRRQIEDLEERRTQLEMMLRWRDEVKDIEATLDRYIADHIAQIAGFGPNESGMRDVRRWAKKFALDVLLSAIDQAFAKHMVRRDGVATLESWNTAFSWVERFARSTAKYGDGPEVDQMLYVQGILRRRVGNRYFKAMDELKELVDLGYGLEDIQKKAKTIEDEVDFYEWILRWIDAAKKGTNGKKN